MRKNISDLRSSLDSIEKLRKDEAKRAQDLERERRTKDEKTRREFDDNLRQANTRLEKTQKIV